VAEINLQDAEKAVTAGWTILGIAGAAFATIGAGIIKLYKVIRRFDQASQDIEMLKQSESDRKDNDIALSRILERLTETQQHQQEKIGSIDAILPRLMDQDGVWAVFGKQQQALDKVEASIRHDMTAQHSQLRAELTNRMDDMKSDLRQANDNLIKLITRTPTQRADD